MLINFDETEAFIMFNIINASVMNCLLCSIFSICQAASTFRLGFQVQKFIQKPVKIIVYNCKRTGQNKLEDTT